MLVVFAKQPLAGKVKTRLGASIGYEQAAAVYTKLLDYTLRVVGQVSADVEIHWGKEWSANEMYPSFQHNWQVGNHLGERMQNVIASGLNRGYESVVIIGSDCPEIDSHQILMAFEKLKSTSVVFGPANDGGYYLVGMSKLNKSVFQPSDWSHSQVLAQAMAALKKNDTPFELLDTLSDLDTVADLSKFPQFAVHE